MKLLININELDKYKSREPIPLECEMCRSTFYKPKNLVLRGLKGTRKVDVCSKECWKKIIGKRLFKGNIKLTCAFCGKEFERTNRQYKKINIKLNKVSVCSRKCAAFWQNKNGLGPMRKPIKMVELICNWCGNKFNRTYKRYIAKKRKNKDYLPFCSHSHASKWMHKYNPLPVNYRSRLEVWTENKLKEDFPNLEIKYNDKNTINGELDIYIPSLQLAFELNGIYHYEPIYGEDSFIKRQQKDKEKLEECFINKIELYVIDCRKFSHLNEHTDMTYYNFIKNKIGERVPDSASRISLLVSNACFSFKNSSQ